MAMLNARFLAFNRGLVSKLGMARVDMEQKIPWAAEIQDNMMPRVLGSMMLRPGLQYTGNRLNNNKSKSIPFIYKTSDFAEFEITDLNTRIWLDDAVIQRVAVGAQTTNGSFTGSITGWNDNSGAGAGSAYDNGSTYGLTTGNYLRLIGTRFNRGQVYQGVTPSVGDTGKEHAIRIVVARGPIILRIGTTNTADDYIVETTLGTGTHSIAITPTGTFYIQVANLNQAASFISSITIEAAGDMILPTPWPEANLNLLRSYQINDVVFITDGQRQQRKYERRTPRSWSTVLYEPIDGPFRVQNLGTTSLQPSALTGDITVLATAPLFRSGHVGALFQITSTGQTISLAASGANQFTANSIKVTGVGSQRVLTLNISGTWAGTITLQRSVGAPGNWVDVNNYTTNQTNVTYNDGLDNSDIYYQIGIKTGNYTSGTANISVSYASGSLTGVVKVTKFNSSTSVNAAVMSDLGGTTAGTTWAEGEWSDYRGWPQAPALYEGRLSWTGNGTQDMSLPDAYDSFDPTVEGDGGVIQRSFGDGGASNVNWVLPLQRLVIGADGAEVVVRSSSLDEILTPSNWNTKTPSTQGSAPYNALKIDTVGYFINQAQNRIFSMTYNLYSDDFSTRDETQLIPELGDSLFTYMATQRTPDTRMHVVRGDGTTAVQIIDTIEQVRAWITCSTAGVIEDCFVLPGIPEQRVYYTVARTVNGQTVRFREKWALESECVGGTLNKQADAFITGANGPASDTISLPHLIGMQVVVWADGKCFLQEDDDERLVPELFTVAGDGTVTLPAAVTSWVAGLQYTGRYKSTKLAYGAQGGTALNQEKIVQSIGFVMKSTHIHAVMYGLDFDDTVNDITYLDPMPLVEDGETLSDDHIYPEYDKEQFEFDGDFDPDSRFVLQVLAPLPATIMAAIVGMKTNERA